MDAFFSLQAVTMCFATVGVVQILKKLLDRAVTEHKRKTHFTLDVAGVGLLLPIVVGMVLCVLIPMHPQTVIDYAAKNFEGKEWQVHAMWGSAIGQISDYVVTKWKRVMKKWAERSDAGKPEGV